MKIENRIMLARKKAGLSQKRLAIISGVSRSACSQWERGHAVPSVKKIIILAQVFDVRFEWLATGRGEMNFSNQVSETNSIYKKRSVLPLDQEEILEKYREFSDKKKKVLLELIRLLEGS